jgi:exonuclease SbcC
MKFKKVELHAFRAYENRTYGTFDFINEDETISNFISIYAPNGFGKTSFYDGVEWCMTNDIKRFSSERAEVASAERKQIYKINDRRKKQFILKNKNAIDENGEVTLLLNDNSSIQRPIPIVGRNGGSDYSFNNDIERKFFKDVILSQEGIDNFLREDNSQDRFQKFIDYFGNEYDTENHKKLKTLISKNKKNIIKLEEEILKLIEVISAPMDTTIFSNSNSLIKELHGIGINIDEVVDTYSNESKTKLDDKIDEYKNQFNNVTKQESQCLDRLVEKETEVENYFNNLIYLKSYEERCNDFKQLKNNHKQLEYLNKTINEKQLRIEEFEKLRKIYPSYKKIFDLINQKNTETSEKKSTYIVIKEEISTLESEIKLTTNDLKKKNMNKESLKNQINSIPAIYKGVKTCEENIAQNNEQVKEIQILINKLKNTFDNEVKAKERWNSILSTAEQNIFPEIRNDERYKSFIEIIEKLSEKLSFKKEDLKKSVQEEVSFNDYKTQIKELISIGTSIISKESLSTCPLCNKNYENIKSLKEAITHNPMLSILEKDYYEKKGQLETEIAELEKKLNNNKEDLSSSLKSVIKDHEKKVQDLKFKISNYEKTSYDISKINENLIEEKIKLLNETNSLVEVDLAKLKKEKLNTLIKQIEEDNSRLKEKEYTLDQKLKLNDSLTIKIESNLKYISEQKQNSDYLVIKRYLSQYENLIDFNKNISFEINNILQEKKIFDKDVEEIKKLIKFLSEKTLIVGIDNLEKQIGELESNIINLTIKINSFNKYLEENFEKLMPIETKEELVKAFELKRVKINKIIDSNKEILLKLDLLSKYNENLLQYFEFINKEKEFDEISISLDKKSALSDSLKREIENLENKINVDVKCFFYEDLINKIYSKINPHPEYKNVRFESAFHDGRGYLDVFVDDNDNDLISPSLYYSSAQLNALSLSIFLAKALHVKDGDNSVDCIFIDDPIQSMDSINILAIIDLFRSLVVNHDKQIILSTHDRNFHELLKKKIPSNVFGSKFIRLETFGKVVSDNA